MIKRWKVLRRRYLVNTPWLKVKSEAVRLPNNKVIKNYYSICGDQVVAVFIIDERNRVLLVRQYRHAVRDETIDIPGGGVKKGESPVQTARREVLEETGYHIKNLKKLLTYYPDSGKKGDKKFLFFAEVDHTKRRGNLISPKREAEFIEYFWQPLPKLYTELQSGRIIEATLVIALSMYKVRHKR